MPDSSFALPAAAPPPPSSPSGSEMIEALKADLLMVYRAVIALEKRVNESTVNVTEIKPQLIALKVHTESFPNALREMHRSNTATQKLVSEFETRLLSLEALVKGTAIASTV
jgi:hypothetical protein